MVSGVITEVQGYWTASEPKNKTWKPEPTFEFPNTVIISSKDKRSKH